MPPLGIRRAAGIAVQSFTIELAGHAGIGDQLVKVRPDEAEAHRTETTDRLIIARIDVDPAHLDLMLARISDELRGGIEAHRL